MKQFLSILLVVAGLLLVTQSQTFAAISCQVTYGGGEVCQGQSALSKTYPPASNPNPTPTPQQLSVPPTTSLPSTGTSGWSIAILSVAGVAGVLLLLL